MIMMMWTPIHGSWIRAPSTEKIAGVRQVERPLGTRLSDQAAAQEDKFQIVTRTEEEKEKILAAAALSEHRVVAEEHMVAATAKDFYGDGSKGIQLRIFPQVFYCFRFVCCVSNSRHFNDFVLLRLGR
jgi:hypothetical protein